MKLVITPHRPWRKVLVIVGSLLAAFLAIAVAFDYGHWKSIAGATVSLSNKRTLLEEAVNLRRENDQLRYELTRMRRGEEINRHARKDGHDEMVRLQTEIASLKSEVDFYREVVGATGVNTGPRVNGIQLHALGGQGRYAYKLVMTHVSKDDRSAEGSLNVDIRGERRGQRESIRFNDLVESGPTKLEFKFKHFRLFEGTLKMPAGFVPRQIQVAVLQGSRNAGRTQTFDWASVVD